MLELAKSHQMQLTIKYMDLHVGTSCVIELLVTKKIKYP
jgi:hypothetical protein